jgi:hypothetical protein
MAFVSTGAFTNLNETGNVSVASPAGIVDGDTVFLMVYVLFSSNTTEPTVPGGFGTAIWKRVQNAASSGLYIFAKAASSEPGTYTVNQGFVNAAGDGKAVAFAYSGRNNSSLVVASSTQSPTNQEAVTTITIPALTATASGQDYMAFVWNYSGQNRTLSAAGDLTLRVSSSSGAVTLGVLDVTSSGSGSISGKTATSSTSGDYLSGAILLAAAGGGGGSGLEVPRHILLSQAAGRASYY